MQPMYAVLLLALISVCSAGKYGHGGGGGGGPWAALEMMGCLEYAKAIKMTIKDQGYDEQFKACKSMPDDEKKQCLFDTAMEAIDNTPEGPSEKCLENGKRILKMA